jgi:hypothetical protein
VAGYTLNCLPAQTGRHSSACGPPGQAAALRRDLRARQEQLRRPGPAAPYDVLVLAEAPVCVQ